MNNKVLIILVNWKRAEDTCACLASLQGLQQDGWHAVVCENGSPDDSGSVIRSFLAARGSERVKPLTVDGVVHEAWEYQTDAGQHITLLQSTENLGFAGGNNLALRACTADNFSSYEYFWFLNNDTLVLPDTLAHMLTRMQSDPLIGICGSTLVYEQARGTVQALGGAIYSPWTGLLAEVGQGSPWPQPIDEAAIERTLDYVSGASMLVSASFLNNVGPMAEDYFLYYEELDWAERGRRLGYVLAYASRAIVFHKEGAALGSGKSQKRSEMAEYYGLKNKLRITRRFFPYALPSVFLVSLLQVARRLAHGQWSRAGMMLSLLFGLEKAGSK